MKKKQDPLISVIIPVYNVENYLEKCLDSVINQTYRNLEIILIDDGSMDTSGKICNHYALQDKRIKVVHQKNGGSSQARNQGLKQANGTYISFIDADDILDLSFVEILLYNALKNNADISGCRFEVVSRQSTKKSPKILQEKKYEKKEYIELLLQDKINFSCCTKLFKANIIADITFPPNKKYEDMLFLAQAVNRSKKFVETSNILYFYVIRKNSNTTASFDLRHVDFIINVDNICAFVQEQYDIDYNLCNRKKIQARLNILHKMLMVKKTKNNVKRLQQEIKTIYMATEDKSFFSWTDKFSVWLSSNSLFWFKALFSVYLYVKPYIAAFKKR